MIDRIRRVMLREFPGARRWPVCAAVPAMLLLAAGAQASQPLPRSGANPGASEVPLTAATPAPPAAPPESVVEATRADLLKRLGPTARAAKPELAIRESVVWSDGGLGCPDPGAKYTMAQVPGWRLVWRADGRDWEYHAGQRGAFVYCEPGPGPARAGSRGTVVVPSPPPRLPTK